MCSLKERKTVVQVYKDARSWAIVKVDLTRWCWLIKSQIITMQCYTILISSHRRPNVLWLDSQRILFIHLDNNSVSIALWFSMVNDRLSSVCYGYDISLDHNLRPWLIVVRAYPIMHCCFCRAIQCETRLNI